MRFDRFGQTNVMWYRTIAIQRSPMRSEVMKSVRIPASFRKLKCSDDAAAGNIPIGGDLSRRYDGNMNLCSVTRLCAEGLLDFSLCIAPAPRDVC